jgi:hypothetical protein
MEAMMSTSGINNAVTSDCRLEVSECCCHRLPRVRWIG